MKSRQLTDLCGHKVGGEDSVRVDNFHRKRVSTRRLGDHLHRSTTDVTGVQVERGKTLGDQAGMRRVQTAAVAEDAAGVP